MMIRTFSPVLSFRSGSGSGERVRSPVVSQDGKTSPYMESDSQVNTHFHDTKHFGRAGRRGGGAFLTQFISSMPAWT